MSIIEAEALVLPFGVHRGRSLAEVARVEVSYFDYLLTLDDLDFFIAEAVKTVASKHGRKRKPGSASTGGSGQMKLF